MIPNGEYKDSYGAEMYIYNTPRQWSDIEAQVPISAQVDQVAQANLTPMEEDNNSGCFDNLYTENGGVRKLRFSAYFICRTALCWLPGAILWGVGSSFGSHWAESSGQGLTAAGLFYCAYGHCGILLTDLCLKNRA
ncbi:MAG: hypothetical protein WD595_00960 [Waddliaceae bacterium]